MSQLLVCAGHRWGMAQHNPEPTQANPLLDRRGLLDVATLAGELGVSQRFVRRLVAENRVPFLKIGKFVRFDPREIDLWVGACRRPERG